MDLQGTPIGSSTGGTKVKTDPLGDTYPRAERAGPVVADSLAAESTRQGGGFSENRGAEPLGVKGSSSTFATTDTSGATTLAPARDATERDAQAVENEVSDDLKGPGGRKFPEAVGGQADYMSGRDGENEAGGSVKGKGERSDEAVREPKEEESNRSGNRGEDDARKDSGRDNRGDQSQETGSTASGNQGRGDTEQVATSDDTGNQEKEQESTASRDQAPSYVANVTNSSALGGKPKGKNLTEGGFDDDPAHNASFNTDIKSDEDPGREGVKHFQGVTQATSGDSGPTQKNVSGDGQFDVLDADEKL